VVFLVQTVIDKQFLRRASQQQLAAHGGDLLVFQIRLDQPRQGVAQRFAVVRARPVQFDAVPAQPVRLFQQGDVIDGNGRETVRRQQRADEPQRPFIHGVEKYGVVLFQRV